MNAVLREQRYKRLQFLLSKSNMYTSYLVQRMRSQQDDEQKKLERSRKRQERERAKRMEQRKANPDKTGIKEEKKTEAVENGEAS